MDNMHHVINDSRRPNNIFELCLKGMFTERKSLTSSPLPVNAMTGKVIPWGERVFEDNLGALYCPESKPHDEDLHEYVLTVNTWLVHIGHWGGVRYE